VGVELLTDRYKSQIAGVLSCYDRIIIQGTVPNWCYAKGMTDYFYQHQIRIFDYPKWAQPLRDGIRENIERLAAEAGTEFEFIRSEARRSSVRRSGSKRCWKSEEEISRAWCAFCRRWSPAAATSRGMTRAHTRRT
jgi:hypothetical protein